MIGRITGSLLVVAAVGAVLAAPASAVYTEFWTLSLSNNNLAATATAYRDGDNLKFVLTNSSTADVLIPAEILTAVFFDYAGAPLTPVTPYGATLATASDALLFPPAGPGDLGGEWAYTTDTGGLVTQTHGIGSAGFGIFGDPSFGDNWMPPDAVDGLNFGITSDGDNPLTGNTPVTGSVPLVQNSVAFYFTGLNGYANPGFANVRFQYGTALDEGHLLVPEPATLYTLGTGLFGLFALASRRRKKV